MANWAHLWLCCLSGEFGFCRDEGSQMWSNAGVSVQMKQSALMLISPLWLGTVDIWPNRLGFKASNGHTRGDPKTQSKHWRDSERRGLFFCCSDSFKTHIYENIAPRKHNVRDDYSPKEYLRKQRNRGDQIHLHHLKLGKHILATREEHALINHNYEIKSYLWENNLSLWHSNS